MSVAVMSVDVN